MIVFAEESKIVPSDVPRILRHQEGQKVNRVAWDSYRIRIEGLAGTSPDGTEAALRCDISHSDPHLLYEWLTSLGVAAVTVEPRDIRMLCGPGVYELQFADHVAAGRFPELQLVPTDSLFDTVRNLFLKDVGGRSQPTADEEYVASQQTPEQREEFIVQRLKQAGINVPERGDIDSVHNEYARLAREQEEADKNSPEGQKWIPDTAPPPPDAPKKDQWGFYEEF
jgi:hypothetical protein